MAPSHRRGEVILVRFPHSDLRTAKTRPALVVQADDLETGLAQWVVAMITSRMFRADHARRVVVLRSSSVFWRLREPAARSLVASILATPCFR